MLRYEKLLNKQLKECKDISLQKVFSDGNVSVDEITNAVLVFCPGASHDIESCRAPANYGKGEKDKRAPGCTKQTNGFIKNADEISKLGGQIFIISSKDIEIQKKVALAKGWDFASSKAQPLYDKDLQFVKALGLDTFFASDGVEYADPVTFIVRAGKIVGEIYVADRTKDDESELVLAALRPKMAPATAPEVKADKSSSPGRNKMGSFPPAAAGTASKPGTEGEKEVNAEVNKHVTGSSLHRASLH